MTPELLDRLKSIAMHGQARDSVAAARVLLGYGWGQPTQHIEADVPAADRRALAERIAGLVASVKSAGRGRGEGGA
jgi:hypothetical protein